MLFKKQAVHDAWSATDRTLDFKITIKDKTYTATDITNLTFDSGAMNGATLTIGSTYQNTIKITFSHLIEGLELLDEVTPQIGIRLLDGTWDFTNLGVFILDSEVVQDRNNNTTTLSASDRMCMLGGTYESKLIYPAPISNIAIEVANLSGVKINEADFARIPNTEINSFGSVTYRDAIGYIAQFAGGFATFDRDGLLDVRTLSDPNFVISPEQYQSKGLSKNETFYRIGGITCNVVRTSKDDSGNETEETTTLQSGSTSGTQITLVNPGMTQILLDGLYQQLQDINFYPFSLSWFGDPSLEIGDWITVKDIAGNEFKTPNLLYSLTFGGGLSAISKADTTVTSSANFVYKGQLIQDVENIRQHMNASGNIVSEGIDPPSNPKPGDIWFAKDGPDTIIKTWAIDPETGVGSWQEQVSTKPDEKLQESIDNAAKDAQKAVDHANTAVSNSNKAVSDAGFATDIANDAKASAEDATGKAAEAVSKAEGAQVNADTAVKNSNDALTDAATAINAAIDAQTKTNSLVTKVDDIAGTIETLATTETVDQLAGTVATTQSLAQFAADGLKLKADITTVDTLTQTVNKQGSQLALTATKAELGLTQTNVDSLKKTVTSNTAGMTANANALKLKADSSTVSSLDGRVTKLSGQLDVQADKIAATVTANDVTGMLGNYATQSWSQGILSAAKNEITASVQNMTSDMATQSWTQGKLDLTADGLTSQISSVQTNLDSLSFGYRNLIPNGSFNNGLNGWTVSLQPGEASNVIRLAGNETLNGNHFIFMDGNNSASTTYVGDIISTKTIPLEPSTEYSLRIITRSMVTKYLSFFEEKDKNGNVINDHGFRVNQTDAGHYSANIQYFTTSATANYGTFRLRIYPGNQFVAGEIFLVQGNRLPKDWVSAPEDQATVAQFTSIEQTLKGVQITANNAVTQSQHTQLADQFTSTIAAVASGNLVADSGWTGITGVGTHVFYTGTSPLYYIDNFDSSEEFGHSPYFAVKPNTKYTLSFKAFADNKVTNSDVFLLTRSSGSAKEFDTEHLIIGTRKFSGSTAEYVTAQVTTGASDNEGYIRFDNNGSTDGTRARLYFAEVQLEEGSVATPYKLSVSAAESQITQLQSDINLRVQKGDVINQINISPESILIAGQKVHITGQTTIDNAIIKDAMIANLSASKLTAGTIDAGKINVVNLNASNITTGTITGSNLSIDLNTGEILFTKGSIKSTNGKLNINVDDGTFSETNGSGDGIRFQDGALYLTANSWKYGSVPDYGVIQYDNEIFGDKRDSGLRIMGKDGIQIGSNDFGVLFPNGIINGTSGCGFFSSKSYAGLSTDKNGLVLLNGGVNYSNLLAYLQPQLRVGTGLQNIGSIDSSPISTNKPGENIYLAAKGIALVAQSGVTDWSDADFSLGTDGKGYARSLVAYNRTYSSGDHMIVTDYGTFGRISSASKYKLNISKVNNITEQAHAFLAIEPKQWFDKAETEDVASGLTTGIKASDDDQGINPYYGFIAEDLYSAGLDRVVSYGTDGELEGIQYDRLTVYHHELIRELYQRVNDLEAKIYLMEANK